MYLSDLMPRQRARVVSLDTSDGVCRRLLDIGLTSGAVVECVGKSPCKDPTAFLIRGAVIALREKDARKVLVKWE